MPAAAPLTDPELARFGASIELAAAQLCTTAAEGGKLDPTTVGLIESFGEHHREHAAAFQAMVEPPIEVAANQRVLDTFGPLVSGGADQGAILNVLSSVEESMAATHLLLVGQLVDPADARTVATILPIEAQHAVVLGQVLQKVSATFLPAVETVDTALDPAEWAG